MAKNTLKIQKAYQYHCKGLKSKDIATLLNCSYRTIQGYMSAYKWHKKQLPTNCQLLAVSMLKRGYTRKIVAKQLGLSVSTISNYKRAVTSKTATK